MRSKISISPLAFPTPHLFSLLEQTTTKDSQDPPMRGLKLLGTIWGGSQIASGGSILI